MGDIGGSSKDTQGGWKRLLIPLLAVTVVGGGGGGLLGFSVLAPKDGPKETSKDAPKVGAAAKGAQEAAETTETGAGSHGEDDRRADAQGKAHEGEHGASHGAGHGAEKGAGYGGAKSKDAEQKPPATPAQLKVKELPPIVANLGGKERAWVRIQSAILYDPHELEHVDTLIPALLSDITAFIGTLELSAIEGPDGLRRLQEELSDRASTRSERRVRELIIEALVVQ